MQKASDVGLDLVEVSPQVVRPRKNKKKLQLKKLR